MPPSKHSFCFLFSPSLHVSNRALPRFAEGEVVADAKVIAAQAAKMKKEFDDRKLCPSSVIEQAKAQRHKMLTKKKAAAKAKQHGKKHGKKAAKASKAGKAASNKRPAAKASYVNPYSSNPESERPACVFVARDG